MFESLFPHLLKINNQIIYYYVGILLEVLMILSMLRTLQFLSSEILHHLKMFMLVL